MSVTPVHEKKKIRAYIQSHLEIFLRVRQFFEQERKENHRISFNDVLARTAATGVNRNIIPKIQPTEDFLNWKEKPGVPFPTRSDPVVPMNFSSSSQQIVRKIYLEYKQVPTLDFILKRMS